MVVFLMVGYSLSDFAKKNKSMSLKLIAKLLKKIKIFLIKIQKF